MKFDSKISDVEPIVTDDEIRMIRAMYAREWRRKNPDKQKAIVERYWRKKVCKMKLAQDGNGAKE